MVAQINYDIAIWELIRFRVQHATSTLVGEINKEVLRDLSLREFWGEYPVPWQLRQVIQQRAESWLERLYALSRDAYVSYGRKVSVEFDQALWAYHIEPFIFREMVVSESGYKASMLLELLLCAVGSPPEKRNHLKVGQKDCCLQIRKEIYETWYDKLHHLPPRINEAIAAMARHKASELRAVRIAAGLPAESPAKNPEVPESSKSQEPVAPPTTAPMSDLESRNVPMESQGPIKSPQANVQAVVTQVASLDWGDIEISFLSDERVQIRIGRKMETRNYAEFGFQDGRTENPNRAWQTLRRLAELRGTFETLLTPESPGRRLKRGYKRYESYSENTSVSHPTRSHLLNLPDIRLCSRSGVALRMGHRRIFVKQFLK